MEPTIDQLTEALEKSQGKTPREVIDAFMPEKAMVGGLELVEVTAGHQLFLIKRGHPFTRNLVDALSPQEVCEAMFALTRPSRDLSRMERNGTYEDEFYGFLDEISSIDVESAALATFVHWKRSEKTVVSMSNPHAAGGSKKKAASGGGSR